MLLVLLGRGWARRFLGPRLAYALWLIPALRMIMPALPAALFPLGTGLPLAGTGTRIGLQVSATDTAPIIGAEPHPIGMLLLGLWLTGAALFLAAGCLQYNRFLRRHKAATLLRSCGGIAIGTSDVDGPLAGGILRRFVLLPRDFRRRYSSVQRNLALRHEFGHHSRGDIAANAVALFIQALHWWNPVAYLAHRAFHADQELACDADVLKGRNAADRRHYAEALVATTFRSPGPACGWSEVAMLKRRLLALRDPLREPTCGRVALALAMLVSGMVLTASVEPLSEIGSKTVTPMRRVIAVLPVAAPAPDWATRPVPSRATPPKAPPSQAAGDRDRLAAVTPTAAVSAVEGSCPVDFAVGGFVFTNPACEGERTRRRNLEILRQRILADVSLDPEQRARTVREVAEEIARPHLAPSG